MYLNNSGGVLRCGQLVTSWLKCEWLSILVVQYLIVYFKSFYQCGVGRGGMVRCGAGCGRGRRWLSRYSSPVMKRPGPGRQKYTGKMNSHD